jgi:Phosphotransferase enzyme family
VHLHVSWDTWLRRDGRTPVSCAAVPVFIPASPEDLTPEWLTSTMRAAGALPTGRVRRHEVLPLTDGGTGFTGETVRVRLEFEGADHAPSSVIAKFPTGDRQNRGMLEQFDAYAREIRFYREFSDRMPCPVPTYLGADYDEKGARRTGARMSRFLDGLPDRVQLAITRDVTKFMRVTKRRYALLLEDLGADTTVYDMAHPPSDDQLGAVLDVLAAVHAAFWLDDSLDGNAVFRPIVTTTPGLYQTVGRKRCLALARDRWSAWMTEHHVELINDAIDRFPSDVAAINEKLTLIHGDPRSDNILFGDDGRVVLLDWALAGHAHPGFDIGYLLSSCVDNGRMGALDGLVSRYVAALTAHGVDIDGADLRSVVAASYRSLAVQQLMSVAVLHGDGYDGEAIFDLWFPRILAGLAHEW